MLLNSEWKGTQQSLSSSPAFMPDVTMFLLVTGTGITLIRIPRLDCSLCASFLFVTAIVALVPLFANFALFNLNQAFVTLALEAGSGR